MFCRETARGILGPEGVSNSVPTKIQLLDEMFTVVTYRSSNTHKSAKTHDGNVFVTRDLDL